MRVSNIDCAGGPENQAESRVMGGCTSWPPLSWSCPVFGLNGSVFENLNQVDIARTYLRVDCRGPLRTSAYIQPFARGNLKPGKYSR
jgi:hypothetical protein